ncbi:polysaccharide biosynthesis tyrosine autokinase [Cellulomonas wangsupingiae]|uniref:polysaccharide biosynthesis tyrosine autokinase n=1 Tax=Cellulomonas wangsupingiae TaxID=2968085 RepID=UPI001D0E382A|nr:polysaccharide biosynthesis tyrosine autokinase [Cellulomonas wangsupingiae]MCM0640779.1 polysaccharide biosynthesis tyrosine autokinase [Cellulomonas wangsupingiae]
MTLRDVLRSARKHWAWVVLPVVVLTAGMAFVSSRTAPVYRSTATLYVALAAGSSAGELNQGSSYTQGQMTSFARLATLPVTLDPVVRELGLDVSPRSLAGSVAVSSPKESSLLEISVTGGSPERTASVANAVALQLGKVVEDLAPAGEAGSTIEATVVSEAVAPTHPVAPNTRRNVLAALLAGVLLGLVAAWGREALDTRVRHQAELRQVIDVPVLGSIRQRRRAGRGQPVPSAADGARSEDFRRVRANLEMIGRPGAPKVLVFTSALEGEGKSFVASRVAVALAAAGARTLLVDADLRQPTIADQLGVEGEAGLTDCLVGRATLAEVRQDVSPQLSVLASGPVPPNPAELLSYPEFGALLDEAAAQFDVVIVDAPPVVPVADAAVIARRATGVVVVADAHRVRRPQLRQAADAVQLGGGRVVGTILNRERGVADDTYGYGSAERRPGRGRRGRRVAPAPVAQPRGAGHAPDGRDPEGPSWPALPTPGEPAPVDELRHPRPAPFEEVLAGEGGDQVDGRETETETETEAVPGSDADRDPESDAEDAAEAAPPGDPRPSAVLRA